MHLAGNLWANDENKFGHKLMEKMGWEKGKGLGANQVNCKKIRYAVKKVRYIDILKHRKEKVFELSNQLNLAA